MAENKLKRRATQAQAVPAAGIIGVLLEAAGTFGSEAGFDTPHMVVLGISIFYGVAMYALEKWGDVNFNRTDTAKAIKAGLSDGTWDTQDTKNVADAAIDDISDLFSDPDTDTQGPQEEGGAP